MNNDLQALLHELIGMQGQYQGHEYELVEVLDAHAAVVLERCDQQKIQNDALGKARRLVNATYTVPLKSTLKPVLHPVLQEFLGPSISQTLSSYLAL